MNEKPPVVLVFADWFLPGFKAGGPIRSLANLVESLDDCTFFLVTRITDHHSTDPYPGIEAGTWLTHVPHARVMYKREGDVNRTFILDIIRSVEPTHIYLNSLFSPRFTLLPLMMWKKLGRPGTLVLAPRGMLKTGALSVKSRKKSLFLFIARHTGLFKGVRWHATNAEEANEIQLNFDRHADVHIAPNVPASRGRGEQRVPKIPRELRLVSIARISPEKGILDGIRFLKGASIEGKVRLRCFGTHQNAPYLKECMELAATVPNAEITFPGEIRPDSIPGELDDSHFLYAPTWGENYGHAIAEALLHGLPVMVSDRTPWRELTSRGAGWDIPLNEEYFTKALNEALEMDAAVYLRMSDAAAAYGNEVLHSPQVREASRRLFT